MTKRLVAAVVAALILTGSGLLFTLKIWQGLEPAYFRYRYSLTESASTLSDDIALYEKRTLADPAGALDPATLAELYVAQGKATGDFEAFRRAEAAAFRSLRNRPASNPGARLVLADIAQARHQFRKAISIVRGILRERPGADEVLPVLITSQLALGELTEADRTSRAFLDQSASANAHALRAIALEAEGRDAEAEFHFIEALRADELGNVSAAAWNRAMLARFYLYHGKVRWARALIQEALRIAPAETKAIGLRAKLEEETGDLKEARNCYRQAFAISKQVPFLLGEARVLLLEGRADGSVLRDQGETLLRTDLNAANGIGHRSELIRLLLERDHGADSAEALTLAREEVATRPNSDSYILLARAEWRNGLIEQAREHARVSLASGVHKPEIYLWAAVIERDMKNQPLSVFYLESAKSMSPNQQVMSDSYSHYAARVPKALAFR